MVQKVVSRTLAVLLSLIIGLLLIEGAMRLFRPVLPPVIQLMLRDVKKHPFTDQTILPPPAWRPVSTFQMTVVPGLDNELQYPNANVYFHVTSKNWLDPNSNIAFRVDSADWEPQWPIDIVAVGDSFTFCFTEVADCWVNRLQTDHGLGVVNLGQGATGGVSHANVLFTFGLPYKPKVVLWQWYGNDNNEDYGLVYESQSVDDSDQLAFDKGGWLAQNSAVFKLIDIFSNAGSYGSASYQSQADTHSVDVAGDPMFFGRSYSWQTADLAQEKNRLGQEEGFEAILTAHEMLADAGIELVVFPIPYKEEVYRPIIGTNSDFDLAKIDQMEANRRELIEFCRQNNLTCFDPTAELSERAADGEQLYFAQDTHLNPRGNEVLLNSVISALDRLGLLPAE